MRSINNSIDTPSIRVKLHNQEKIDEMKTTKTIKKPQPPETYKQNLECQMYIFISMMVEVFLLITDNSQRILNITRCIVGLLVFSITILFRSKMKNRILISLICFVRLFQISSFHLSDSMNLVIILPLTYQTFTTTSIKEEKLQLYEQGLIKILSLSLMSAFLKTWLAIVVTACILLLDGYRIYHLQEAKAPEKPQEQEEQPDQSAFQKQIQYQQVEQNNDSSRGEQINQDDIWKKRFQGIPLSIVMISKANLNITYKNIALFKQFCDSFINEEELEDLIMHKLNFSLISEHQELVQLSSTNIIKLKKKQSNPSNLSNQKTSLSQLSSYDLMQKRSLADILNSIKSGQYAIEKDFIELFCQQTENSGVKYYLEGKIIYTDNDEEFIVIINDISKQVELQQFFTKEEFKSKIIESFSHELRTPLNSAINFIDASISDPNVDDQLKLQTLEPAVNSLKLQAYLINDIIDYQNYNANQLELNITEFSFEDFLSELTSLFSIQFDMKKIAFSLDLSKMAKKDCLYFNSDQTRLTQILVNLLQNSLKYTSSGVIKLKISTQQNDMLKFVIEDTGIGISPQVLDQIRLTLQNVEQCKDFQTFKGWKGFGLLITSLLHQSLCPPTHKSITISSTGFNQGSKIKFYILNFNVSSRQNTQKLSQSVKNTLRQSQSVKKSLRSNTNSSQFLAMNGTLVIANDLTQLSQHMKKSEFANCRSNTFEDVSDIQKSPRIYCSPDTNIQQLFEIQPVLITQIKSTQSVAVKKYLKGSTYKSQQSKLVNLKQFRKLETQYREDIFKTITTKRNKCNCNIILSVDDEIFNQKSVQRLLQQIGFEVLLAFSGDEAIKIVKSLKPCSLGCSLLTVILMDYQMPIKDGLATTKELICLMTDNVIPEIPIIGLTAFTGQQDVRNCLIAGMIDVLSKPLKIQELKDVLSLL